MCVIIAIWKVRMGIVRTKFYLTFPVKIKNGTRLLRHSGRDVEMDLRVLGGKQEVKSSWWRKWGCFLAQRQSAGWKVSTATALKSDSWGASSSFVLECMWDVAAFSNFSGFYILCWKKSNRLTNPLINNCGSLTRNSPIDSHVRMLDLWGVACRHTFL